MATTVDQRATTAGWDGTRHRRAETGAKLAGLVLAVGFTIAISMAALAGAGVFLVDAATP
ncbi:MAG TPA: hypothetical protein VFF40_02975 [Acidimicrobiia bacterium]|nr:hypothetical protein [Acidimicrobiia bacterium]